MTRTLRSGCLLTTVAASSCTDTDAEIRLTSDAKIPMNSTSEPLDSSSASLPGGSGGHHSRQSTPSVLGSAVNTTPTPSTIATSSSCEMPASSAADSSSRLMEKEIVNERSDPRFDNDSDIAERYPSMTARNLTKKQVVGVCREWIGFRSGTRSQVFVFRRLLVTPRLAHHPRASRRMSRGSRLTSYTCEAAIFGATFANLSHVCRDGLRVPARVFRTAMYDALMPIAKNFKNMVGPDVPHLARGLCSHRVIRLQMRHLWEVDAAPRVQTRDGHAAGAFGAAASILVLFKVLALDKRNLELDGPLDAGGLGTELERIIEATLQTFVDWPLQDALDASALRAEQRALQRAYIGVRLARMVDVPHESVEEQFARRLGFFAQCAWPSCGYELGHQKHHQMLDAIASGCIATDEWVRALPRGAISTPMVVDDSDGAIVPLSALHAGDRAGRGDDDDDSSVTLTATTHSTLHSGSSSAGDAGDLDDRSDVGDAFHDALQAPLQDALRVAQLAIAAATAATAALGPPRYARPP